MTDGSEGVRLTRYTHQVNAHSVCSGADFTIRLYDVVPGSGGSSRVGMYLDNTGLLGALENAARLEVVGAEEIRTMADGFEALAAALREIA